MPQYIIILIFLHSSFTKEGEEKKRYILSSIEVGERSELLGLMENEKTVQ